MISTLSLTLAVLAYPLCEPVDASWKGTRELKRRTEGLIAATAARVGFDPRFAMAIAKRESRFLPYERNRRDSRYGKTAYVRGAYRYGWRVEWSKEARKAGDVNLIEYTPRSDDAFATSASYIAADEWVNGSLGSLGMVPSNHVWRWDPDALPEVLCDPVIATIVLGRFVTHAMVHYGARSWLDVHSVYAGRIRGGKPYAKEDKDTKFCALTEQWGLHCGARAWSNASVGMSPGQEDLADSIRGESLEMFALRLPGAGGPA